MNEEMREKCMKELYDVRKTKKIIRIRGNMLTSGMYVFTNPLIKLECEKSSTMFIELMELVTSTGFCSVE
jgi:hypothetical protein